uniref:interleukin-21 receptor n=1 Tax=Doryrhamphus excisus TaxID=161450 RepID=UPI0025AEB424|nr:interleukin-21 receptor [Doryrhamphus excisus]
MDHLFSREFRLCLVDTRESLRCVNDFMFTINCSLSLTPPDFTTDQQPSYWLTFSHKYTDSDQSYSCVLANTSGGLYFCSVMTNPTAKDSTSQCFVDFDVFQISLCKKESNDAEYCQSLDNNYRPAAHIIPNAPRCLTASHNSSQRHFTWKTTYEECLFTSFQESLNYQLRFYDRQHKHDVIFRDINTDSVFYSVDDSEFTEDTEYAAKVRSRPSAGPFFGDWSDWSTEVHWRTSGPGLLSKSGKAVLTTLGVMATLLLLCCAPFKNRWRQGVFIPTPALYFQSLYNEYQGDFQSWVDGQTKMRSTHVHSEERALQDRHAAREGNIYENTDIVCDYAEVGIPVKTTSNPSLLPTEDKPGCRSGSVPPMQGGPSLYGHEYCTLSAFQQHQPTTGNAEVLL